MPDPTAGPFRYPITLHWSDDDGAYLATVPDLPGLIADGQTPTRAYYAAIDAAAMWIETARDLGRTIPEPSTDA